MQRSGFVFGDFLLEPASGTLFRQGVPVPVPFRGLQLLTLLVSKPGVAASKSELLEAAWPGLAVEEGNLATQIAVLRRLLGTGTDGTEPIVTIPRIGYRFALPVTWVDAPATHRQDSPPDKPSGPSLAVLPFVNLSDDPEQQYFAEGLAEDIITRLAQFRWLHLVARNSSFSYQGRGVDIKRIGQELGVRYVLSGSVRRSDGRIRVVAELSSTESGAQVWTSRFEAMLQDFFTLQDEVTVSALAAIEPEIYAAERQRIVGKPPDSLNAWGHVMRAMPLVWTWGAADEIAAARQHLLSAIAIDPDYARANCLMAYTEAALAHLGQDDLRTTLTRALRMAVGAVQTDPYDAWTHFSAGYVYMVSRDFVNAIATLREALRLNPSLALAHTLVGSAYGYNGMGEEGICHLREAARLSPRDFNEAANHATMGLCHMMAGRHADAVNCLRRAVMLRPYFVTAWRSLAAACGLAGEFDLGRAACARSRDLQPNLSLAWVDEYHPIVQPQHRQLYLEGLRLSGLT